ncbi:hypothetical protein [Acinetobacter sp. P1(2025)]|uniref:hypothetical protein n=1 Tax=Acinetobacter sp. P1(2025) TaxID=3446120 RepID=UPI003F5381DD
MGKGLIQEFVRSNLDVLVVSEFFYCSCCGDRTNETLVFSDHHNECLVCSFLTNTQPDLFGYLTKSRAHSPVSFINSLLVFEKENPLTLVTTEKYSKNIPKTDLINVVVSSIDDFIIDYLNNPKLCLFVKTNMKTQYYINNMVVSDAKILTIVGSSGNVNINISNWKDLLNIAKTTDKELFLAALSVFDEIAKGAEITQVNFIKSNYVLFSRLSVLLDVMPHSKLYMLKLLRSVVERGYF